VEDRGWKIEGGGVGEAGHGREGMASARTKKPEGRKRFRDGDTGNGGAAESTNRPISIGAVCRTLREAEAVRADGTEEREWRWRPGDGGEMHNAPARHRARRGEFS
jgi:hypothetical protein